MTKTNLEVAKECGASSVGCYVAAFHTPEELDAYTVHICADKDAALRESRANDMESMKQLSEANALIAFNAEALKEYAKAGVGNSTNFEVQIAASVKGRHALSASAKSVAAWEAENLLPLQRQVAMLRGLLERIYPRALSKDYDAARAALQDTQAIAEAYDRELAAKVLDFVKNKIEQLKNGDFNQQSDRQIGFDLCLDAIEGLRADNKEKEEK